MKKFTLPVLGALALSLACTNVFAVDGTITVNGVVTDQTCTLRGDTSAANGLKDITVRMPTVPKSSFTPANTTPLIISFGLYLKNATGTGDCDAATSKAFKGIHLSTILPDDLDAEDKTLLVNNATGAGGASAKNPVFIRLLTQSSIPVDLSAPWGTQAKSGIPTSSNKHVLYQAAYVSKTGIVDAQNFTTTINYTMHYN